MPIGVEDMMYPGKISAITQIKQRITLFYKVKKNCDDRIDFANRSLGVPEQ